MQKILLYKNKDANLTIEEEYEDDIVHIKFEIIEYSSQQDIINDLSKRDCYYEYTSYFVVCEKENDYKIFMKTWGLEVFCPSRNKGLILDMETNRELNKYDVEPEEPGPHLLMIHTVYERHLKYPKKNLRIRIFLFDADAKIKYVDENYGEYVEYVILDKEDDISSKLLETNNSYMVNSRSHGLIYSPYYLIHRNGNLVLKDLRLSDIHKEVVNEKIIPKIYNRFYDIRNDKKLLIYTDSEEYISTGDKEFIVRQNLKDYDLFCFDVNKYYKTFYTVQNNEIVLRHRETRRFKRVEEIKILKSDHDVLKELETTKPIIVYNYNESIHIPDFIKDNDAKDLKLEVVNIKSEDELISDILSRDCSIKYEDYFLICRDREIKILKKTWGIKLHGVLNSLSDLLIIKFGIKSVESIIFKNCKANVNEPHEKKVRIRCFTFDKHKRLSEKYNDLVEYISVENESEIDKRLMLSINTYISEKRHGSKYYHSYLIYDGEKFRIKNLNISQQYSSTSKNERWAVRAVKDKYFEIRDDKQLLVFYKNGDHTSTDLIKYVKYDKKCDIDYFFDEKDFYSEFYIIDADEKIELHTLYSNKYIFVDEIEHLNQPFFRQERFKDGSMDESIYGILPNDKKITRWHLPKDPYA